MATVVRGKSRVETAFRSAAPRPNGMTGSPEGLWLIDQHFDDAYLVDETGKVLRRIMTDSGNSSGLGYGGGYLWVALNGGLRGRAARPNDREGFWILKVSPEDGQDPRGLSATDGGPAARSGVGPRQDMGSPA